MVHRMVTDPTCRANPSTPPVLTTACRKREPCGAREEAGELGGVTWASSPLL